MHTYRSTSSCKTSSSTKTNFPRPILKSFFPNVIGISRPIKITFSATYLDRKSDIIIDTNLSDSTNPNTPQERPLGDDPILQPFRIISKEIDPVTNTITCDVIAEDYGEYFVTITNGSGKDTYLQKLLVAKDIVLVPSGEEWQTTSNDVIGSHGTLSPKTLSIETRDGHWDEIPANRDFDFEYSYSEDAIAGGSSFSGLTAWMGITDMGDDSYDLRKPFITGAYIGASTYVYARGSNKTEHYGSLVNYVIKRRSGVLTIQGAGSHRVLYTYPHVVNSPLRISFGLLKHAGIKDIKLTLKVS